MTSLNDDGVKIGQIYSNLVDIMFAIVISQGFVFFSSSNGIFTWISKGDTISVIDTFSIYAIVIGSWIGYHAIMQKFPREGNARFIVDILLMLLYYIGFVEVGFPLRTALILFFIFSLYALWSMLRVREYPESRDDPWTLGFLKNSLFSVVGAAVVISGFAGRYYSVWYSKEIVPLLGAVIVLTYTIRPFKRPGKKTPTD